MSEGIVFLTVVLGFAVVYILSKSIRIVQPYQQAVYMVLGKYRGLLNPGLNLVVPVISTVVLIDLRTLTLDIPKQEVITKDNSPVVVDAIVFIRVINPKAAYFQVENYRRATVAYSQTTLRSIMGDMELDQILSNREEMNHKMRDILDKVTDPWGVKVEAVEIKEMDPVGRVKSAMEEQSSSERERRAAILRADGKKRASILEAEGAMRSRILQAEGIKQARIIEAQGARLSKILEAQGDAQRLRVLSYGAASLDQKGLSYLSLKTLENLSMGPATKIVLPFEISRLVEGISNYVGGVKDIEHYAPNKIHELEKVLGSIDDIIGKIPKEGEINEIISQSNEALKKGDENIASIVGKSVSKLIDEA